MWVHVQPSMNSRALLFPLADSHVGPCAALDVLAQDSRVRFTVTWVHVEPLIYVNIVAVTLFDSNMVQLHIFVITPD
jgi:hypothetical protein